MDILPTLTNWILQGLVSAGVVAFVAWLGRHWISTRISESIKHEYEKAIEDIRSANQRDFVVFGCHLDALRALNRIDSMLLSTKTHPDMDREKTLQGFPFGDVERRLAEFLSVHGPFVPDDVREKLIRAKTWCGDAKFEDPEDFQVMDTAEEVMSLVRNAYLSLSAEVLGRKPRGAS